MFAHWYEMNIRLIQIHILEIQIYLIEILNDATDIVPILFLFCCSMNASSELQLWNYDKFKLISSLKVLDQHLIGNIPAILNKIKFRPSFWQHLKNNQVMHEDTIDEIKVIILLYKFVYEHVGHLWKCAICLKCAIILNLKKTILHLLRLISDYFEEIRVIADVLQ